jgi:protein-tyrosine phosphatase
MDSRRLVPLIGTRNLRDLGGYATVDGGHTRWRTLFRSDCLDELDPAGQAWLIDAGLRTIVDLRDETEAASNPNVFATSEALDYRRVPVWDEPLPPTQIPSLHNGYRRELDLRGARLATILATLLEPGALPALIHCAAGKDRTGLVVALLLATLGVPREIIADDYALSGVCLGPDYVVDAQRWVADLGHDWEVWGHLFETPPERMLLTLSYIDEQFGGAERYLADHGLAPNDQRRLRELLVEDA